MHYITAIGLIAALLTTLSFFPQAIKILKSKNTRDISLPMYIMFTTGLALWFLYGILTHDLPVIVSNAITVILAASILIMKIKYK
ncbi:SemiSWEET transporter [Portibacter marinus]|uniref:SemiSWEET transporter n=1 Tax=Portibacter marinus TaxID=2898660 RepID=UPI001F351286|nr:SemiSWEET transporter [Portibacter marinus]